MNRFEHIAWYNLILANIYAAAGKEGAFISFVVVSAFCMVAAYFERQR